jgi:WD40 repeat protein
MESNRADPGAPSDGSRGRIPGSVVAEAGVVVLVVALIIGYVWVLPAINGGSPAATASPSAPAVAVGSAEPSGSAASEAPSAAPSAPPAPTPVPTSTTIPGGPIAHAGGVVVLENDGSLEVIDAATSRENVLATADNGPFLFPAWSPDGSTIAAIRVGQAGNEIDVFDAGLAEKGETAPPTVLLKSSAIEPFYLSWSPDGSQISYLANETNSVSLRIVPVDGSAPLDGSAPNARIKTGDPLYYDWVTKDRVLAHIGSGSDAFLGELGLDGAQVAPPIQSPGDFRSATVSHDGTHFGYVRAGSNGSASIVLATRDGSAEQTMPVFGTAAVTFAPTANQVASIGPTEPQATAYGFPFGPLRVLDGAGKARTLLDGQVVGYWWSPDNRTIAALRVQAIEGGGATAPSGSPAAAQAAPAAASGDPGASVEPSTAASASPSEAPAPSAPPTEVRLLFVDVASGTVTAQSIVSPGMLFVNQFLTYFDQYALSHELWAPDSSSFLLPVDDSSGTTRIEVAPRNGDQERMFDGAMAFWSP